MSHHHPDVTFMVTCSAQSDCEALTLFQSEHNPQVPREGRKNVFKTETNRAHLLTTEAGGNSLPPSGTTSLGSTG